MLDVGFKLLVRGCGTHCLTFSSCPGVVVTQPDGGIALETQDSRLTQLSYYNGMLWTGARQIWKFECVFICQLILQALLSVLLTVCRNGNAGLPLEGGVSLQVVE